MPTILLLLTIAILLIIARQDLSTRSVTWFLFPLLAVSGMGFAWLELHSVQTLLINIGINTLFLLLQFGLLKLWFLIRTGRRAFLDHAIGKGDLFFMLAAGCFFSPVNFVLFHLSSLVLSLLIHLIFRNLPRLYGNAGNIPLAGLQAACLILVLAICTVRSIPATGDLMNFSS